jgi:hypothetical protein
MMTVDNGCLALSHATDGAAIVCDAGLDAIVEAFDRAVTSLGYTDDDPADVEVITFDDARGGCVAFATSRDLALAIGQRLARRLGHEVRVLTASVREAHDRGCDGFACKADDVTIGVNGSMRPGPWAAHVTGQWADNWGAICDGKMYFAVPALLEDAIQTARAGATPRGSLLFRSPPSLGSSRLDDLAMKARASDRAVLSSVDGRDCIRITSAGTTITSFLEPEEARALQGALPELADRVRG